MRTSIASLVVMAACGAPPTPPTPPQPVRAAPSTTPREKLAPSVEPEQELAKRAEQLLDEDAPLDYARPLAAAQSAERPQAVTALLEACKADHKPSCWKAMLIAPFNERATVQKIVEQNCRGGDAMSCRALPADAGQGLDGSHGRSPGCQFATHDPCDVEALRRECTAGFPDSCRLVATRSYDQEERDALFTKMAELAQHGCAADIFAECMMANETWTADARFEAARRRCKLDRSSCAGYARHLERRDRRGDAVLELERACQYGRAWQDCLEVGVGYLDKKYEEPVPGRGKALVDRACREMRRAFKDDADLNKGYPDCKRASKK